MVLNSFPWHITVSEPEVLINSGTQASRCMDEVIKRMRWLHLGQASKPPSCLETILSCEDGLVIL